MHRFNGNTSMETFKGSPFLQRSFGNLLSLPHHQNNHSTMKLASTALALATIASTTSAQTFVYLFDGARTNGIDGDITVTYDSPDSTRATISAKLDFSKVNKQAIVASDGNCTGVDIVDYKWHVHVKWSSPYTSESLGQCGKALTGNHYDPLKACGPFSEFIDTPECQAKIAKAPYACNPAAYLKDPRVCEKGDIAGKGGDLHPDHNGLVHVKWVDEHYPSVWENTPEWNFILHAVCGKATPRVACALGQAVVKLPHDWKFGQGGYDGGYKGHDEGKGKPEGGHGGQDEPWKPTPAPTNNYDQGKPKDPNNGGWYPGQVQSGGY